MEEEGELWSSEQKRTYGGQARCVRLSKVLGVPRDLLDGGCCCCWSGGGDGGGGRGKAEWRSVLNRQEVDKG